jgi:putative oxidoreductase
VSFIENAAHRRPEQLLDDAVRSRYGDSAILAWIRQCALTIAPPVGIRIRRDYRQDWQRSNIFAAAIGPCAAARAAFPRDRTVFPRDEVDTMSNDVAVDKSASPERAEKTSARGRIANRVLYVVQVLVGLDFLVGATMKLSGMPHMVAMFDDIGAGQWLRYFVGLCELSGGIGLMIPALSGLAAIGLAALMVGALYVNVFILHDSLAPLMWMLIALFIAWRRWPRTKALFARSRQ